MRIAVVGSGIAGLGAAWLLSRAHEVTLFEAEDRLGGHTHTHDVRLGDRSYAVDTGFIVHNPVHYPLFTRLLDELHVPSQPTTMSFAVHNAATGLEYNATDLDRLFCQRRNLGSPRFLRMVAELMRFYRHAPALLDSDDDGPTLGEYLGAHGYGAAFRDEHIVPMASALWSSPPAQVLAFPAKYLVRFMANHHMLQVTGRPQWQVVQGGSRRYVDALQARWKDRVRVCIASPVRTLARDAQGVQLHTDRDEARFDHVVLACHSDQALALLADAQPVEREVLGAITYQANETVLHTDTRMLPRNRKAWAAWNAYLPGGQDMPCTVSYCMNLLQGIDAPETFVVTLNRSDAIDPGKLIARMRYTHPVYTRTSVAAQRRKAQIQGRYRTWFAGAYWGWGFHEDGLRSAVEVVDALGAYPP